MKKANNALQAAKARITTLEHTRDELIEQLEVSTDSVDNMRKGLTQQFNTNKALREVLKLERDVIDTQQKTITIIRKENKVQLRALRLHHFISIVLVLSLIGTVTSLMG